MNTVIAIKCFPYLEKYIRKRRTLKKPTLQEAESNKKRNLHSNTTLPAFSKDLCTSNDLFDGGI